MGVDELITLDDGKEYVLLTEAILEGNKYFLAVEAVNEVPTENFIIFKQIIENGELSVEEVDDEELRAKLVNEFEVAFDESEYED